MHIGSNATAAAAAIKIARRDWQKLPAWIKLYTNGVAKVLSGGRWKDVEFL